ncbi:DUF4864 domain-containing protein [Hoeflea sp. G2-23]|uniref:DUF4864 domain-containing protein n=1 Tax=Hoeflea algicola TaxID=2983763 RepID=A0ABT3Z5F5_9HYPH|nr:DUF4864 domain-containing protein [Hoeflea algicola]MCY0146939.1 DUF4864 domain-containing protein [Hoeflea algicola]
MLLVVLTPAVADEAGEARTKDPATAARNVIESQIQAFLNDDSAGAYSFAAPAIKQLYPDETRFFDMVKRGYAPVFRPGNFAFGRFKLSADGSGLVQEVLIEGPNGQDWTALYSLQRQPDGSFRIDGVQMIKTAAPQT